ncbi:MAG: site-specific DNA-methyltransferase [Clostridiales Family XIII bacterium]|jgi:DNA modification methylase|nr:site-specific DNA-methyltransferase [Clostridiales Family XIII bacterium]
MALIGVMAGVVAAGRREWEDAKPVRPVTAERVGGARDIDNPVTADDPDETDGAAAEIRRGNALIQADNLGLVKYLTRSGMAGKFQLIYIDPPFFSGSDYGAEIKFAPKTGEIAPAFRQIAYRDSWKDGLDGYLRMLTARFFGFRELLSETGCFWVHLDWHAAHYVRVILDEVFGAENFVNEVIWNYKSGGVSRRRFARKHDTLLFYGKTPDYYFKAQSEKSYNRGYRRYRFKGVEEYRDELGWYTMVNMKDVWRINMVGRTSAERTGYATQKPEALLARIVESCTREGELCADFFGGSGTLAAAAEKVGRRWLSCDSGRFAVAKARRRLTEAGACFSVMADAARRTPSGRFRAAYSCGAAPGSAAEAAVVELAGYAFPAGETLPVEEKYRDALEKALLDDSMRFVDYWSVDFHYDGVIYRPEEFRVNRKSAGDFVCRKIGRRFAMIAVSVTDIFGVSSLRVFERPLRL